MQGKQSGREEAQVRRSKVRVSKWVLGLIKSTTTDTDEPSVWAADKAKPEEEEEEDNDGDEPVVVWILS